MGLPFLPDDLIIDSLPPVTGVVEATRLLTLFNFKRWCGRRRQHWE